MIYAIYKYGLRMEAIGFLDMYMFWHLQFSVSGFAIFGDSLYHNQGITEPWQGTMPSFKQKR